MSQSLLHTGQAPFAFHGFVPASSGDTQSWPCSMNCQMQPSHIQHLHAQTGNDLHNWQAAYYGQMVPTSSPTVYAYTDNIGWQASSNGGIQQPSTQKSVLQDMPAEEEDSDDEGRDACEDIAGLVKYLDNLDKTAVRITEVAHVVNKWRLHGIVVPMKHHGVIFRTSAMEYLRAHLVQDGIAWKVYTERPRLPDTTCYSKTYETDSTIGALREFCRDTKPWSWPSNDCEKWAHGALRVVGVKGHFYCSVGMPHRSPRMRDLYRMWKRRQHGNRQDSQHQERKDDHVSQNQRCYPDNTKVSHEAEIDARTYSRIPAGSLFVKA